MRGSTLAVVVAALSMASAPAFAQESNVTIRDHAFEPQEIRVLPAGKRVSIYVSNEDASAEEWNRPGAVVERAARLITVGAGDVERRERGERGGALARHAPATAAIAAAKRASRAAAIATSSRTPVRPSVRAPRS